jgi:hypothetical protein
VQSAALAFDAPCESVTFYNLEARREFAKVESWLFSEEAMKRSGHEIEGELFERSREITRKMLEAHIRARGQGNVGKAVEVTEEHGEATTHTRHRVRERHQSTLFGEIPVERVLAAG